MSKGFKFEKLDDSYNDLKQSKLCLDVSLRHGYKPIISLIINSFQYSSREVKHFLIQNFPMISRSPSILEIFYKFLAKDSCIYRLKLWMLRIA